MTDDTERHEMNDGEKHAMYSREEALQIARHRALAPRAVYEVIDLEGREELKRPLWSLWWSGIAAGICISTSVLAEGILHTIYEGHPYQGPIENMGYTVGFILVILARIQLFTENTITVVLPVLKDRSRKMLTCTMRLWAVVFAANLVGTFFVAFLSVHGGTVVPEYVEGMKAISEHFAEYTPWETFKYGVPAGFFIAAIVWMLPSAEGFEIFLIFLFTYLIAMGEFTHVVAGSKEAFLLMLSGDISVSKAIFGLILPAFAGNVLGGTGLFALLAYGQVAHEIDPELNGEAKKKGKG
ncbi:formate/nitrite transporter family protein [Roseivivax sp. THAF30]|jgi:formate/nitrite transporter FocA (FNT family)|uniref:formate/nitrite transporter family protein n=1 Tax=Roseivivax sp. THAF30 TaxID=2587852 RepID=UPI0012A9AE3D|nr:formate/nitrite transporter family protein [Roseivivax sp. THAF30]QFT62545.1 Inner membrane protein YfdC [Roseivivax sp. THAF30]